MLLAFGFVLVHSRTHGRRCTTRERDVCTQALAAIARALIVAFWMLNRSRFLLCFRIVGTVQMLPFGSVQDSHGCLRDTDQLV